MKSAAAFFPVYVMLKDHGSSESKHWSISKGQFQLIRELLCWRFNHSPSSNYLHVELQKYTVSALLRMPLSFQPTLVWGGVWGMGSGLAALPACATYSGQHRYKLIWRKCSMHASKYYIMLWLWLHRLLVVHRDSSGTFGNCWLKDGS